MTTAPQFDLIQGSPNRQIAFPDCELSPLNWIGHNCVFTPKEGRHLAYKPVGPYLFPFQKEIINSVFDKDGRIDIDSLFLGFGRKFGKTWVVHLICTYLLSTKVGFNIVNTAGSFQQSGLLFSLIKDQITYSPSIKKMNWKIRRDYLENLDMGTKIEMLSSTSLGNLGLIGVSAVVCDELSAIKKRSTVETLLSGFFPASGERALSIFISNPPDRKTHWSYEFVDNLRKDKGARIFEYSIPKDENVFDENNWHKANPLIGEYQKDPDKNSQLKPLFDNFKKASIDAEDQGGETELEFRRYRCGQRVSQQLFDFVDIDDIKTISEADFKDLVKKQSMEVFIGLDLAIVHDFTALVVVGYDSSSGKIFIKPFLTLAKVEKERPTRAEILQKRHELQQIIIQFKEGQDHKEIEDRVNEWLKQVGIHLIQKVLVDPNLYQEGTFTFGVSEVDKVYGTPRNLTLPIRKFQAWTREKRVFLIGTNDEYLEHLENAVVSPRQETCIIRHTDPRKKIDGAVATVNALIGIVKIEAERVPDFTEDDFKMY